MRIDGGLPTLTKRSEARAFTILASKAWNSMCASRTYGGAIT
jgi:hypothetical protein